MFNLKFGKKGEKLAARFLEKKGYVIRERNFRYGRSEIDLIAMKGPVIVFVEVKTRSSALFGNPEMAVNSKKANQVKKAAEHFLQENAVDSLIRFDIVAILWPDFQLIPEIYHFEDAF